MFWTQKLLRLAPRPQGIHLITPQVTAGLPELAQVRVGAAHLFLQHTSAGLALNEAVEPEVRADLQHFLERLAPENAAYYTHQYEGPDDMPAHIKTVLVGSSVTVPITAGRLALGSWQGVYLCEFRRHTAPRRLLVTLWGTTSAHSAEE
jgi:secondary thiamine-phosphate synthase enzyme